jgi:hypothetical protein
LSNASGHKLSARTGYREPSSPRCSRSKTPSPPRGLLFIILRACHKLNLRDLDITRRLRTMGIRDKPIAPASPWQNGFAERLIGSIRRECLDHFVVLGEVHLCRILRAYARYYNAIRTHRSLNKDAPVSRPVQRTGNINSHAILGGLHHHYVRV